MSWMMIEGEELVRLKRRINETTGWKTNCLTAGRARVSFYANGNLLYLKGKSGTACAVEGGDGTLFPLDESSAQIYEGNEAAGLPARLQQCHRLRDFLLRLSSRRGRRPVSLRRGARRLGAGSGVDQGDLTPRAKSAVDGSGGFEITAYVAHCNELFRALFRVESDGEMMMLDDEPLGRIISLQ